MIDPNGFQFNPDLGLDAELAGIGLAGATMDMFSKKLAADTGRELTTDESLAFQEALAPGFAHFYSLAEQAGQLAGGGDALGAISLVGGIDNARELLGDEITDALLAQAGDDLPT